MRKFLNVLENLEFILFHPLAVLFWKVLRVKLKPLIYKRIFDDVIEIHWNQSFNDYYEIIII